VPKSKLEKIDLLTTYGLMAIGGGLILGLLTRLSALAGAVFLASIVLAQPAWPTIYPPLPPAAGHSLVVTKELIEMLALLALAATPVGRWAGLDFFVHNLLIRPCCGGKGKRHASHG
jgi:thiosulfate dehydrogenase [quinone] large subunit